MTAPRHDSDLHQHIGEVGRREADTAPTFARVLRGRSPSRETSPTFTGSPQRVLAPAALAILAAFLVVALAWRWPHAPEPGTVVSRVERSAAPPPVPWDVPTDGLLIDAGDEASEREVQRLSRQIEALLQQ